MRVDFSYGESLDGFEGLALELKKIRILFRFLKKELSKEDEYQVALKQLEVKTVGSIQIHICDDIEMRSFQKQYRNLDRTTDVLSFPSIEVPGIQEQFSLIKSSERTWGSLVLSLPAIERGAKRGRRSLAKETTEVLIHGFLHLLGMDHVVKAGVTPKDAKRMLSLQRRLLREVTSYKLLSNG